ncbi:predicted protein [Sclerotinia sclerotiorum 1980 UF-70]|uniref:Uncharacterized protein n=1 Tax=Sclerotinia sclerotiorum (strain ATCC 18683 / 1980 / Ss-1) TaxID=665079 RepID=A7E6S9_SCLS1|nr:predicted protein [Sclerotinia sclerotiorum 1980 UF-70]EDN91601.1 predicted protein [Sclerotinia sclerotiorum 1980 UF-70]
MTEGPHHSQELSLDEENVPNETLEPSLTFLNTTFGTNAFLQEIPDINCQWQTMGFHGVNPLCSVYPSPNVLEPYNDLWPFDTANTNLSNPYFPETAAINTSFDNCDNFEDSLSHFESDGWLTSFLQSPEPITYSPLQVGTFTERQSPCEPAQPSVEALPKNEGPRTYTPEIDSSSNHFKEDVPTLAPSKLQTDLSSPPDQLTPHASEPVVVTPRNMEDCLIDFHSGVKAPKRKRKEFNRREKLKVHLVRQVGACQSCRARKVECTSDGVCDRCFKLAGDPVMAKQICIRHKLKDVYLGVTDVQTRLLTSGKEQVYQLLGALEGHVAKVELRADCSMASFPCRSLPCKACLCNAAFRITSLNSLAFYGVANIHCHPHGQLDVVNTINDTFSPDTVREQVRLKASEGLEESEKYFFSEIENLCKKSASNKQTRIIAGICLLRLMLFYRERVVRIELRSNLPRCKTDEDLKNCIHPGKTDPQKRLGQCGFMYKQLAVAFSTLCRGDNTPLTIDWEAEAAGRVAPDVPMLSNAFLELKSAYAEFSSILPPGDKWCPGLAMSLGYAITLYSPVMKLPMCIAPDLYEVPEERLMVLGKKEDREVVKLITESSIQICKWKMEKLKGERLKDEK